MTTDTSRTVDIHSHFMPEGYLEAIRHTDNPYGARLARDNGAPVVRMRDGSSYDLPAPIHELPHKLDELARLGFDATVLSPPLTIVHYELEGRAMAGHVRMVNDGMAAVQAASKRVHAMALVPMQDPDFALGELERASESLGLRAGVLCTNILGANLDEPMFRPVFRRASELDVLLFVHAWFVTGAERLGRYHLINSIGNPFDATIAVASIIFSGMLDELPNLKICVAHGGGATPYIAGRIDRGYEMREPARSAIPRPPSSYLSRLYYDSILHDEGSLQFLVDKVGADRVLAGSDCPYQLVDAGDPRPLERVASLDITPAERAAIAGGNALTALGG